MKITIKNPADFFFYFTQQLSLFKLHDSIITTIPNINFHYKFTSSTYFFDSYFG